MRMSSSHCAEKEVALHAKAENDAASLVGLSGMVLHVGVVTSG